MKLELGGKIKNMHPNPSILVLPMQKGDLIMMDSLNFIKKYKVIKMGGHRGSDKTLCTLDDLNTAIRWAKKQIINRDRLAVFEYRYTSEENLKKDFHFDYSLKWAAYL